MAPTETIYDLFDNSQLNVLFLEPSDADDNKARSSESENCTFGHVVESKQRRYLFLDEVIYIHVVFQTPPVDETSFLALRGGLEVSLELLAVGPRKPGLQQEQETEHSTTQDTILSWSSKVHSSPFVLDDDEDENGDQSCRKRGLYWKVKVHLRSSQINSHNTSLHFSALAKFQDTATGEEEAPRDEYLPSGRPVEQNPFDALATNREAARKGQEDDKHEIRVHSRSPIRLLPALRSRVRLSHIGTSMNSLRTLTVLDFAAAPILQHPIELQQPSVFLSNGTTDLIPKSTAFKFPLLCSPQGQISLVYELKPARGSDPQHSFTVATEASIKISKSKHRRLQMTYKTVIDLPTPKPPLALLATQPTTPTPQGHDANPGPTPNPLSQDLTLTISAPPKVQQHKTLTYTLLVANSNPTEHISVSIYPLVQPEEARDLHERGGLPRPTSGPFSTPPVLMPLTPDLRVGPLAPRECTETTMQFLVLGTGVVKPLALRVVEMDGGGARQSGSSAMWSARSVVSGRSVNLDGDMLPDVVAVEQLEGDEGTSGGESSREE